MCRWRAALLRLVRSVPWPFQETTTPRPAVFLNLLVDLGSDLYESRFSIMLNTGRCRHNLRSKEDLKTLSPAISIAYSGGHGLRELTLRELRV